MNYFERYEQRRNFTKNLVDNFYYWTNEHPAIKTYTPTKELCLLYTLNFDVSSNLVGYTYVSGYLGGYFVRSLPRFIIYASQVPKEYYPELYTSVENSTTPFKHEILSRIRKI
jgi:hypothetical protein